MGALVHASLLKFCMHTGKFNMFVSRRSESWQKTQVLKAMSSASEFYSLLSLELPPSALGRAESELVAIQFKFHLR